MIADVLRARTAAEYEEGVDAAVATFENAVGDGWLFHYERAVYTEDNYASIWKNEMRKAVKDRLTEAGKTPLQYRAWMGETHYIRFAAAPALLFDHGYQDNKGWRILLLGVPAARVVAVGLASHYQGGQNHNSLADASNVFFDHISGLCSHHEIDMVGRKVAPDDWDRGGLIQPAISTICDDVEIGMAGGLWLKEVRTTTLKKTIASLISVEVIGADDPAADDAIATAVAGLRDVGNGLLAL